METPATQATIDYFLGLLQCIWPEIVAAVLVTIVLIYVIFKTVTEE